MSKVLFLSNHFLTLFSFRKEMIQEMVNAGHDVWLSLPQDSDNVFFEQMGCKIALTKINRRGLNPLADLALFLHYRRLLLELKPDIVFSFTIKPNIYGSLASNWTKNRQICNITGTGATFLKRSFLATLCKFLYRISVKHCYKTFFQNTGDRDYFINNKMIYPNRCMMLPGSGCNLDQYSYKEFPSTSHLSFIYIGRVMKLKGIDEYLTCAKAIHGRYKDTTFYIAGWNEEFDYMKKVELAEREGYIHYLGFRKDIAYWIEKCHCTILPSHGGEGVPNVLLESAATGRICIASNINGSRDVIDDGVTGFLFSAGDSADLISKVECFIHLSDEHKEAMSIAARKKIEKEFDRRIVVEKYLNELLAH